MKPKDLLNTDYKAIALVGNVYSGLYFNHNLPNTEIIDPTMEMWSWVSSYDKTTAKSLFSEFGLDVDRVNFDCIVSEERIETEEDYLIPLLKSILFSSEKNVFIRETSGLLSFNTQAKLVSILLKYFPEKKFIFNTQSLLIMSNVEATYRLSENSVEFLGNTYGLDAHSILRDVLDSYVRCESEQDKLNRIFDMMDNSKLDEAEKALEYFADKPQMSDVLQAKFRLRQKRKQ